MVTYNNEIGLLPQEIRERNKNAREEDESFPTEKNQANEKALRKDIKKLKLTTEQFQQHLNTDPKLKNAYAEHQALMEKKKQATERVKNTGYLGTLWGGITGDSGVDDLAKINEDMNSANTQFRNALDQNAGLSNELKNQLIGYKLGADSGINIAASEASGDFSERANDYKNATIATAVGAGALATGGFVGGLALAGGATYAAGGGTMLTLGGAAAGGALAGEIGARGYSLTRDGMGVMMGGKGPSVNEYIEHSNQAGAQGRVFGAALPLAAVPAGQAVLTGVGSYSGAKSIQNSAENFSQAHQLSGQESAARKSGNTELADQLKTQKNVYITEGTLSVGDTAAVLGVGNRIYSTLKKAGGATSPETGASPTSKGTPKSPDAPESTPANPRELNLGTKNGAENSRKNPNKPVEGVNLPESGTGFQKVSSSPAKPSLSEPKSPHDTHTTSILEDGTKIIQGNNMTNRGPFQNTRIEIRPDGSYRYSSNSPQKQGEFTTRIVNKEAKITPESGDSRPLTFFDQRGYGKSGLEPKITRKEGFDTNSNMNFKTVTQVQGLSSKAQLTSFSHSGEKPIMPPKDLQSALHVELPKDRQFYRERAQKRRADALPSNLQIPSDLPTHLSEKKAPQQPSTPPEKLKNVTLDPDELIKQKSLKK